MITLKEYYSDVWEKEDEKLLTRCRFCKSIFPTGEILLEMPKDNDYDTRTKEYCPICKKQI